MLWNPIYLHFDVPVIADLDLLELSTGGIQDLF